MVVLVKMRLLIFLVLSRYGLGCKCRKFSQASISNWMQNCFFFSILLVLHFHTFKIKFLYFYDQKCSFTSQSILLQLNASTEIDFRWTSRSYKDIWIEDRSEGLPSTTSGTKELTERNLAVIFILWTKMKSRRVLPNV